MKKIKFRHKLTLLSVIGLLMCLLCLAVSGTFSWFTYLSTDNNLKVEISVYISNINIAVYQTVSSTDYKINTINDTVSDGTKDFVELSDITEILPDTTYSLTLKLKNEETSGTDSMYVRYKVEFVVNYYSDSKMTTVTLTPTLTGYTDNSSTNGFVKNATKYKEGYYYYQDTSGENALFTSGESTTLMTDFSIPYAQIYNSGNLNILSGATVKMLITVECSDDSSGWQSS